MHISVIKAAKCKPPNSQFFECKIDENIGVIFYLKKGVPTKAVFATIDLYIQKVTGYFEKTYWTSETFSEIFVKVSSLIGGAALAGAG